MRRVLVYAVANTCKTKTRKIILSVVICMIVVVAEMVALVVCLDGGPLMI